MTMGRILSPAMQRDLPGPAGWLTVSFAAAAVGAAAFVGNLLLWGLIVATMAAFWRLRRLAAMLLAPYLAWIAFATALTLAVWQLDKGML